MKPSKNRTLTTSFRLLFVLMAIGLPFLSSAQSRSDAIRSSLLRADDTVSLLQMREEEKMARDVYLNLYELYGLNIFANISSSEQVHMDEVLRLIETYGLTDPVSKERGVFQNQDIQTLYNDLMEKGKKSLNDALLVGATIEDVDIFDLQNFIANTENKDIQKVYSFLNCGSRNHLRAFTYQLDRSGMEYVPIYISDEEYAAILNSNHEPCGRMY